MMGFLQRFAHRRILREAKKCIKSTTSTTTTTFPPLHRIIYPDPVTRLSNQPPRRSPNFNAHAPFSYPKTSFTPEYLITTRRNHTSSSSSGSDSDSDSDRLFKLTPPCLDIYMMEQTGRGIGVILGLIVGITCEFLGVGEEEQKQNLPEIVEAETLPVTAGNPVTALGPGGLSAPHVGMPLKEQDGSSDAPPSSGGRSSPSP
ncbi:hypothetical protein LguiA_009887 [Lonicera macranthoides]